MVEKSNFDFSKKKINKFIMWVIPFIWYFIIKIVLQRIPGSHEIPEKRESGTYHENGHGAPGAGIIDHERI